MEWKNVIEYFTEEEKNYNGKYLEIDYVGNGEVEVSLFSSKNGIYEIYINFGKMYGIVYVEKRNSEKIYYEIKDKIEEEYKEHKEPTNEFINEFDKKYKINLPDDLFFI